MSRAINVQWFKGNPHAPLMHPLGTAAQHADAGVVATLDAVFDAPPVVKHILCEQARTPTPIPSIAPPSSSLSLSA